jgi:hypothetical protein
MMIVAAGKTRTIAIMVTNGNKLNSISIATAIAVGNTNTPKKIVANRETFMRGFASSCFIAYVIRCNVPFSCRRYKSFGVQNHVECYPTDGKADGKADGRAIITVDFSIAQIFTCRSYTTFLQLVKRYIRLVYSRVCYIKGQTYMIN